MLAGRPVENLVLMPGTLATERNRWQTMANDLPLGTVLIVMPAEAGPQRAVLEQTARSFEAKGRAVTVVVRPPRGVPLRASDEPLGEPCHASMQLAFDLLTVG